MERPKDEVAKWRVRGQSRGHGRDRPTEAGASCDAPDALLEVLHILSKMQAALTVRPVFGEEACPEQPRSFKRGQEAEK